MQTRWMSFVEALANIGVGYALAVMTQVLVFPFFGLWVPLGDSLLIGVVFTMVSLARSFALRRVFNSLGREMGA